MAPLYFMKCDDKPVVFIPQDALLREIHAIVHWCIQFNATGWIHERSVFEAAPVESRLPSSKRSFSNERRKRNISWPYSISMIPFGSAEQHMIHQIFIMQAGLHRHRALRTAC